jgi:magnesium chelatase family protein
VQACPVQVEVDVAFGLPGFAMVGLPDASVRESRDRVRSAIRNTGFEFPAHRVTVNLAPADVRKAGGSFDLPIALGILAAQGVVERRHIADVVLLGELSLDGSIHPTRGVLPIAAAARRDGAGLLLSALNASEASLVGGLDIFPVHSLDEAVRALNSPASFPRPSCASGAQCLAAQSTLGSAAQDTFDLCDVRGQLAARRALEIAAAGGHNLLMIGPPGAGKTMIARRMAGILPALTFEEALEVTTVHSVAGLLPPGASLVAGRPFRAPHHTISHAALAGGGSNPRPGEVSLAHHGVLFLDEMLEFSRHVLETLRQPVEEGWVAIARAARTEVFPARFVLVGATNPCPCGFFGDTLRECRCTAERIARYRDRLSGPLRDRFDLTVQVSALPPEVLSSDSRGEPSAAVRARVVAARRRQGARYDGLPPSTNAQLNPASIQQYCSMAPTAVKLLDSAIRRIGLSARGYDRIRKVARTIADLEETDRIESDHVAEALQFRSMG